MSRNINNIDDLLRDSFEDFSSAPSPVIRAKISKSIKNFNFLRFNPGSFNVFYMAAIVLGTSVVVSISTGVFSSEYQYSETIKSTELGKDTATEQSAVVTNFEATLQNTDEINISEKNAWKSNNSTLKQSSVNNVTDLNASGKSDNFENKSVIITEPNLIQEEKSFIFDTIVETVKIVVTDTIKTEVRKTVEMKKNRRNQK